MKLRIVVKLFVAGLILFLGVLSGQQLAAMVAAGMLMSVHTSFRYRKTGKLLSGDDQEELMEELKKMCQKLIDRSLKTTVNQEDLEKEIEKWNKKAADLSEANKKKMADDFAAQFKSQEDELNKKFDAVAKENKELVEKVNLTAGELKAFREGAPGSNPLKGEKAVNLRHALAEGFAQVAKDRPELLEEVDDSYGKRKSLVKFMENGGKATFEIKAPIDMFESTLFAGDTVAQQYALSEIVGPRVTIPLAVYPHVTQVFSVKNIRKPAMALMVMYGFDNGVATKAEGVASVKSSLMMKAVSFKAFYIATHFVLSDETMEDLDEVIDEIGAIGPDKILSAVDGKVFGTAGDDSTDIKGIRTTGVTGKSTVFDAAAAPDVPSGTAKRADVYAAMKLQAYTAGYKPNLLIIPPDDEFKIGADKNTLSDSRQDRRIAFDAQGMPSFVAGMKIAVNNGIPANQAIVLDNSLAWIGIRRGLTVEIGLNGTDLIEGQRTIVIKIRVAFGVRDKAGIVWSSNVDNAQAQMTPS